METWLIVLLSVLGGLLLLAVMLPLIGGVIYRMCTRKCRSNKQLEGKTVIVTGASAGIGRETALFLAGRRARVIMACRNMAKSQPIAVLESRNHGGICFRRDSEVFYAARNYTAQSDRAKDSIIRETGNQQVVLRVLDLADLTSVRKFANQIIEEEEALHILINNAGILMRGDKCKSPQGFELTLATNHFGCFLLTNLLLDKLKASAPSRIVVVSSVGYMLNNLDVDDLNFDRRSYDPTKAYCQSKLCNILFTKILAQRIEGSGVTANCVHPGFVATEIFDRAKSLFGKINELYATIQGRTTQQGAQTTIYVAISEEVEGKSGSYYDNCKKTSVYRKANDMELARKLWDQTSKDVGLTS